MVRFAGRPRRGRGSVMSATVSEPTEVTSEWLLYIHERTQPCKYSCTHRSDCMCCDGSAYRQIISLNPSGPSLGCMRLRKVLCTAWLHTCAHKRTPKPRVTHTLRYTTHYMHIAAHALNVLLPPPGLDSVSIDLLVLLQPVPVPVCVKSKALLDPRSFAWHPEGHSQHYVSLVIRLYTHGCAPLGLT